MPFKDNDVARAYIREWRAAHRSDGLRADDYALASRFANRGKEMAAMMNEPVPELPWPKNLFGDPLKIATLMAQPMQQQGKNMADYCVCGREHHRNIPRTIRSTFGHGFNVVYYCSDRCKGDAVRKEGK